MPNVGTLLDILKVKDDQGRWIIIPALMGPRGSDGNDGITPTVSVTNISGGHNVSFYYGSGDSRNRNFNIMDGTDGTNGVDGTDGETPLVDVTSISGGHLISFSYGPGDSRNKTFYVMDGTNGTNGTNGTDGITPTVTITPITGGNNVAFYYGSGDSRNKNFNVLNGTNGTNGTDGDDGITPTVTVTTISGGHNVAFSYGAGDPRNTNFDVLDGLPGEVPAAAIAGTQASTTASKALAVGEHFWLNGTLYTATSPIASGGTIVTTGSGKNCDLAVIGDELTSQSEKITELKSALEAQMAEYHYTNGWENVGYNDASNAARLTLRITKSEANKIIKVVAPTGYTFALSSAKGTSIYVWTGTTWSTANLAYVAELDLTAINYSAYDNIAFTLKADDSSNIDKSVGNDVLFFTKPYSLNGGDALEKKVDYLNDYFYGNFDNNLLFCVNLYYGYYYDTSNVKRANSSYSYTDLIEVKASTTYTLTETETVFIQCFTENKAYISSWTSGTTFTTPSNAKYVRLSILNTKLGTARLSEGVYISYGKDAYNRLTDVSKIFMVGAGQTYTTLRAGINAAILSKNSIVYVLPGTYDLVSEFSDAISSTMNRVGLTLQNGIHVIFYDGAKVTALFDNSESTYDETTWRRIYDYFNPIFCSSSDVTIENLDIEASNTRYCVHDEASASGTYIHKFINCRMKYKNDHSDVNYVQCIGGGLGEHGTIEIDGGFYESETEYGFSSIDEGNPDSAQQVISYHNASNANANSSIIIKNVYAKNRGYFRFGYLGSSTAKSPVQISGCGTGLPALLKAEGTATTVNFELTEFCNDKRISSHWSVSADGTTATLVSD